MRCWWAAHGEWLDGPSVREGRVEGSGVLAGRWSVALIGRAHARWCAGPGAGTALRVRAEETQAAELREKGRGVDGLGWPSLGRGKGKRAAGKEVVGLLCAGLLGFGFSFFFLSLFSSISYSTNSTITI